MKKRLLLPLISIVFMLTFFCCASDRHSTAAHSDTPVMKADPEKGAMFRYWICGAYPMDDEGGPEKIEWELQEIADKGYAGIEVCVLKADYKYDANKLGTYGWGTPKFVEMMKVILRTGNRLGLQIDMTATNGWPIMIPGVMGTNAEERILYKGDRVEVAGGSQAVLYSDKGKEYDGLEKPRYRRYLQAVTAAKVVGSCRVDKGPQTFVWGTDQVAGATGPKETTLLDPGSPICLTEGKDYRYDETAGAVTLDWTPPDDGTWRVFTYWMGFSGKSTSDVTPKEAFYTNYFSKDGARAFIDYWERTLLADEELAALFRENGTRIFEDSIEFATYFGSTGFLGNVTLGIEWTEEFLDEFEARAGYDLASYLPLLDGQELGGTAGVQYYDYEFAGGDKDGGYVYSDVANRIRNDLFQVYTEMFLDNHAMVIQDWAKSMGMDYRFQLYSYEFDTNYASALVSGPEVETLGFSQTAHGYDKMRLVAGGAHMGGRAVVSDEAALTDAAYTLTYTDALDVVNTHYALGANQILWHGFTHTSGVASGWPGNATFGTMLADNWGPRHPSWESEKDFADYLARVQSILQAGTARVDAAVYLFKYGTYTPVWTDSTLAREGYTYDFVSHNTLTLDAARVENGVLNPGGPAYKALIVADQTYMDVATAERLIEYADAGLRIFAVGGFPSKVPFFKDWQEEENRLSGLVRKLSSHKNVTVVKNEEEVAAAMKAEGILPNAGVAEPADLLTARRDIGGISYYYIFNDGDADVDTEIALAGSGNVYDIDLWSGDVTQKADHNVGNGTVTRRLRLAPKGAKMVAIGSGELLNVDTMSSGGASTKTAMVTGNAPADASVVVMDNDLYLRASANGEYRVTLEDGKNKTVQVTGLPETADLSHGWHLTVERWQDDTTTPNIKYDTLKTIIPAGDTDLVSWRRIPGLGDAVSGIGTYSVSFTLPNTWQAAAGAVIHFPGLSARGAAVFVNGTKVYLDHQKKQADVKNLLKPGANDLKVVLYTTLGNQLIADGVLTGGWNRQKVDYDDYGITGPVTVTPYVFVQVGG